MSKNTGTVVADAIVPLGAINATHYDINGQGGFMSVPTLADLNGIPVSETLDVDGISSGKRKAGMLVYVQQDQKQYQLQVGDMSQLDEAGKLLKLADNANWQEFKTGGDELVLEQNLTSNSETAIPSVKAVKDADTALATNLSTVLNIISQNKVDKIGGRGLSEQNYTLVEKQKLASGFFPQWYSENITVQDFASKLSGLSKNNGKSSTKYFCFGYSQMDTNVSIGGYSDIVGNGFQLSLDDNTLSFSGRNTVSNLNFYGGIIYVPYRYGEETLVITGKEYIWNVKFKSDQPGARVKLVGCDIIGAPGNVLCEDGVIIDWYGTVDRPNPALPTGMVVGNGTLNIFPYVDRFTQPSFTNPVQTATSFKATIPQYFRMEDAEYTTSYGADINNFTLAQTAGNVYTIDVTEAKPAGSVGMRLKAFQGKAPSEWLFNSTDFGSNTQEPSNFYTIGDSVEDNASEWIYNGGEVFNNGADWVTYNDPGDASYHNGNCHYLDVNKQGNAVLQKPFKCNSLEFIFGNNNAQRSSKAFIRKWSTDNSNQWVLLGTILKFGNQLNLPNNTDFYELKITNNVGSDYTVVDYIEFK